MANIVFNRDDIEALLAGLLIYGTGGGGAASRGRELMSMDLFMGRKLEIIDVESIEDDCFVCSGGNMGSVKATHSIDYNIQVKQWEDNFPLLHAFSMTEKFHHRKLDYLVPFELGGGNTPIILSVAARKGIPVLDADLVGRAAPETQMAAPIGHGISLYPMCLVDDSGNSFIIVDSEMPTYADEVGRMLIGKAGRCGGNTHYAMSGLQAKQNVIKGSVSKAFELGKLVLAASKKKRDGVAVVKGFTGASELFRGRIVRFSAYEKGGFYLTEAELEGMEAFQGRTCKMIIKNELMLLYVDNTLRMMFPDYGFMVYPETGLGVPSAELSEGLDIVLLGAPCHPLVRDCMHDETGFKSFGPARYGYPDMPYTPIEELARQTNIKDND